MLMMATSEPGIICPKIVAVNFSIFVSFNYYV